MEMVKEFSIPVPWGHIAAKAWGNPTDFPVLCVHGVLDNAGAFDRLIALLPKNHYYVSIDLPGHGFSSHFPIEIPLNFFNYILSVRYIIEELKWKTFNYVGHSMGAQLGTFYSILYPKQIQKLVLIEGLIPTVIPTTEIINRLKVAFNSILEAQNQTKNHLYTYDEIIYTLKNKRQNCLNTEAAEAIIKRSVTQVGELFKYNRDIRLKTYPQPFFSMRQWINILSNCNVEILGFLTTGSLDFLQKKHDLEIRIKAFVDLAQSFDNVTLVNIVGNHDVHNNNPERISHEISKFLDRKNINSKL